MLEPNDGCLYLLLRVVVSVGGVRGKLLVSALLLQLAKLDFVTLEHCHLDFAKFPDRHSFRFEEWQPVLAGLKQYLFSVNFINASLAPASAGSDSAVVSRAVSNLSVILAL